MLWRGFAPPQPIYNTKYEILRCNTFFLIEIKEYNIFLVLWFAHNILIYEKGSNGVKKRKCGSKNLYMKFEKAKFFDESTWKRKISFFYSLDSFFHL